MINIYIIYLIILWGHTMRKGVYGAVVIALLVALIAGCLENTDDDVEEPDLELFMNAEPDQMSSVDILLEEHPDKGDLKIDITLDAEESDPSVQIYLYLFEGAPPPTSSLEVDDIKDALDKDARKNFKMTWTENEVSWELDIELPSSGYYTLVLWHPNRDDYENSDPKAYVDINVYFTGSRESTEEEKTFREYDVTDWSENMEDSPPISALEMYSLVNSHMDEISPGGSITAFTSGGYTGIGLDKDTGKCPGWQVHVKRMDGGDCVRKIINIAEGGWCIIMDDSKVMEYPSWNGANASFDSSDLIDDVKGNATVADWFSSHSNYKLTIQSYHGPPIESDEESYLFQYESGEDTLNVYASAVDGRIIEVKDPSAWSWP